MQEKDKKDGKKMGRKVNILICEKCGRLNRAYGKMEDLYFFKCNCGNIIIDKIPGIETINIKKQHSI